MTANVAATAVLVMGVIIQNPYIGEFSMPVKVNESNTISGDLSLDKTMFWSESEKDAIQKRVDTYKSDTLSFSNAFEVKGLSNGVTETTDDNSAATDFVKITPTPKEMIVTQIASATLERGTISDVEISPVPVVQSNAVEPVDVTDLINRYAAEFGVDPAKMITIAKCESGMREDAVSPSGAYVGLFQFVSSTWVSNRNAMGLDPNPSLRANAEEAIRTAAFKMGRDGYGAWPTCGKI